MNKLHFRNANQEQLNIALDMIEQGRTYLKNQGIDQWQNGYPNAESIQQDIDNQKGYFLTDGEHDLAYLCMDFSGEPAYNDIKGAWLTDDNAQYMVIHRLAFHESYRGKGLATTVFQLAGEFCKEHGVNSIRVDTDSDNKIMQHTLKKAGFTYCGTIWFAGGDKVAFEKVLSMNV